MLTAAALRRLSEVEPSPSPIIVPSPEAAPDDDDDAANDDNSGWYVAIATTLVMGALLTLVCVLGVCLCVIALRRYARAPIGAARPAGPPAAMPPCVEKIELPPQPRVCRDPTWAASPRPRPICGSRRNDCDGGAILAIILSEHG